MKIEDGLKLPKDKYNRVQIPDCNRRMLPDFFKGLGYEVGVEIGVYKGDFTRHLLKRGVKIYGIDPWQEYKEYGHPKVHFQARQNEIYESAKRRLEPYKNCTLIRKMSMDAVKDFEDESIDFVYIDGHHGFKFVTEDIYEWGKKVKKGGIIAGHDYGYNDKGPDHPYTLQVKFVVDAWVKAFRIKKWYVLGRAESRPDELRDQFRSWFWFKE